MNQEAQNNPAQQSPQQPSASQDSYAPQYQSGGYQDRYQGGYGHPPAAGNIPPWAHQDQHHGGYQDQYQGGYGHPPAVGNMPPWAHQDQHRYPGGYGHPPAAGNMPPWAYQDQHRGMLPPTNAWQHQQAYGHAAQFHPSGLNSFFNFRDERFLKGAVTGAALTFLLTNDSMQKNTIKSLVKFWTLFQGGIEEIKERFQDAEAEIKAEEQKHK